MTITKNFWAKKQDNNGSFEWLPLYIRRFDPSLSCLQVDNIPQIFYN